jgi:hypothetical protein
MTLLCAVKMHKFSVILCERCFDVTKCRNYKQLSEKMFFATFIDLQFVEKTNLLNGIIKIYIEANKIHLACSSQLQLTFLFV